MPVASGRLEPTLLILQAQMSTEFADPRFQWSGGYFRERYDAELLMCQLTEMGVMKHYDLIKYYGAAAVSLRHQFLSSDIVWSLANRGVIC